jgi:hypothetical protein
MVRTGQAAGAEFDLDFHAIMHYGHDVALETHYLPRRSQRTQSVLTFFAQDGQTHNLAGAALGVDEDRSYLRVGLACERGRWNGDQAISMIGSPGLASRKQQRSGVLPCWSVIGRSRSPWSSWP